MMISDNYLIINPCTSAVLTLKREMSYCTQLWCIVYMQLGRHSKSASGEQCTQFEVLAGVHTPAWIYMIPYFLEFFKQSKTGGINIPLPQPGSFGVGLRCAVLWYLEDTSAPQEETQQFLSDHSIQLAEWCLVFPKSLATSVSPTGTSVKREETSKLTQLTLPEVCLMYARRQKGPACVLRISVPLLHLHRWLDPQAQACQYDCFVSAPHFEDVTVDV